jgi:hypothetical protein
MEDVKPLKEGLEESLRWYLNNSHEVRKKPFMDYIDNHLI